MKIQALVNQNSKFIMRETVQKENEDRVEFHWSNLIYVSLQLVWHTLSNYTKLHWSLPCHSLVFKLLIRPQINLIADQKRLLIGWLAGVKFWWLMGWDFLFAKKLRGSCHQSQHELEEEIYLTMNWTMIPFL